MKTEKNGDLQAAAIGKIDKAHHLLSHRFAFPFRATYLRGKTEFRDFLYEEMGCSLLEAEMLVDTLEKNGRIGFQRSRKGARYGTWSVHGNA